jgi:metal-responsive CopG/Arc/MetJ family transcriptional regulator
VDVPSNQHVKIYNMMKTKLEIENTLLEEAEQYAQVTDKVEIIRIALTEFIQNHKKKNLQDLKGKIKFSQDYDYKNMRKNELL